MKNWKRTFAVIWTGQFFSIMTSAVVGYAAVFWLSLETRSTAVLAIATIAMLLPQAIVGLFSGALIDRWNRKLVMIISDSLIAFFSLILALLFFSGYAKIELIYLILALRSLGNAFHTPAMQASVPLLAPEDKITKISGFNQVINSVSNIAGPAIGALLIANANMGVILLLDTAGAVIACTALLFVHIPNPEKKSIINKTHILTDIKEGFSIIYQNKGISYLFLFSMLFNVIVMPVSVIFPLITVEFFHGGAYEMSLVEVFWGIGLILGGALIGMKKININEVNIVNGSYVLSGIIFFLMGILSPEALILFAILTAVSAMTYSIHTSVFTALLQKNIAPEALGRIFSLYFSFSVLPSMIGLTTASIFASKIGLMQTMIIAGISIVIIGVSAMFVPVMRDLGKVKPASID